ncbi:MAG: hypothetical protein EBU90_01495 [Proteobacteria bacterium]|nr:hypothetical protein [Pseudomonadota bacterium]
MNTKLNKIAATAFTQLLAIIGLSVVTVCLIFWLVLGTNLIKLEIVLLTLLLLSSILGLTLLSYVLVTQVHKKSEKIQSLLVNEQNISLFRHNLLKGWEMQNDELQKEVDYLRQKINIMDLLSRIDSLKNVPEKEKTQEPVILCFDEDIF